MAASKREITDWKINERTYRSILNRIEHKINSYRLMEADQFIASAPETDFIQTCAKIATFLTDIAACTKHLQKLNQLLEDKPKLKCLLEQELAKFGFNPKFAKTYIYLETSQFHAILASGICLKDSYTLGLKHGELTHAIQWLMICWHQEETKFLGEQSPIDVYKKFGEETSVISHARTRIYKTMWDLTVDRFDGNKLSDQCGYEFTSPETLNSFIKSNSDEKLLLLKTIMCNREESASKKDLESATANPDRYERKAAGFFFPKAIKISIASSDQPPGDTLTRHSAVTS